MRGRFKSGVANSTGLFSTRAGVGVVMPGGVAGGAGVRGVTGDSGVREELVAAGVVAGERGAAGVAGAGVSGGSGTEVGTLGEEELPTPPAPSKWT
jgi:hypothetical protein